MMRRTAVFAPVWTERPSPSVMGMRPTISPAHEAFPLCGVLLRDDIAVDFPITVVDLSRYHSIAQHKVSAPPFSLRKTL